MITLKDDDLDNLVLISDFDLDENTNISSLERNGHHVAYINWHEVEGTYLNKVIYIDNIYIKRFDRDSRLFMCLFYQYLNKHYGWYYNIYLLVNSKTRNYYDQCIKLGFKHIDLNSFLLSPTYKFWWDTSVPLVATARIVECNKGDYNLRTVLNLQYD